MSAWLRHLVRQSRGAERAVRPATSAYRAPALTANADVPSIESEEFVPAQATPSPGNVGRLPETRVPPGLPDADAGGRRDARTERTSPNPRDVRRDIAEDGVAPPVRSAPRRQPDAEDAAPSRDGRSRSGGDERAPDRATHGHAPADDDTLRLRSEAPTATIRPSLPARAAA
ncbi:MAG TPA: hypothetical protein VNS61_03215, partial [Caldimonas sp.]|nr:hypothetical protein [Caldimonas sp.]